MYMCNMYKNVFVGDGIIATYHVILKKLVTPQYVLHDKVRTLVTFDRLTPNYVATRSKTLCGMVRYVRCYYIVTVAFWLS